MTFLLDIPARPVVPAKQRPVGDCPGSYTRTGGWPGDQDMCPVCQTWQVVRRDATLRKHRAKKSR